jgi:hypothetical protein
VNEWNVISLIVEKWGLPGVIGIGIVWAMYRFGATPSQQPAMTNETAAAISRLVDKIDAHHAQAQTQREEVMESLHGLDKRLAVMEAVAKRPGQ